MGFFSDERRSGKAARLVSDELGEGGSARHDRKRGDLYSARTVKSTSLRNLGDAIATFRAGR